MKGLNLHLTNYKAVADANVELSGLTVLAGVNSSGKSTLARLFHATVQGMRDYDAYAEMAALETDAGRALMAICEYLTEIKVLRSNLLKMQPGMRGLQVDEEFGWRVTEARNSLLKATENGLDSRVLMNLSLRLERMIGTQAEMREVIIEKFNEVSRFYDQRQSADAQQIILALALRQRTGWRNEGNTSSLSISDGDALLFDTSHVPSERNPLYSLQRSVYIDSPGVTEFSVVGDGRLRVGKDEYAANSTALANDEFDSDFFAQICQMTGGILTKNNPMSGLPGSWLFSDAARRYTIPISECAEGIKSVSPLAFLERAGLLTAGTLLVIDEPETHQHPQWIVMYAKMLMWLLKNRKMRILLATHSAYLVRALQTAANDMDCLGALNYYLAEPSDAGNVFKPQGHDIGGIFKTFNVALRETAFYRE